jgi:hypothetical protein
MEKAGFPVSLPQKSCCFGFSGSGPGRNVQESLLDNPSTESSSTISELASKRRRRTASDYQQIQRGRLELEVDAAFALADFRF